MSKYKASLEKLKHDITHWARLIFISLTFLVGVYLGAYLTFNIRFVMICISFLFGCLMVLISLIDVLKGDDEK